jgi:hypothetical protein
MGNNMTRIIDFALSGLFEFIGIFIVLCVLLSSFEKILVLLLRFFAIMVRGYPSDHEEDFIADEDPDNDETA